MKFTHSLRPTSPRSTSVLQFFSLPISRSLVLDPRSPFPIFDCRSCVRSPKAGITVTPTKNTKVPTKVSFIVASKRLGTRLEFRWKPLWKRAGDDYNFWIRRISQRLGNVCSSEAMGRSSSKHKV